MNFDSLLVAESDDAPRARSAARSSTSREERGCTPFDVMLDLSLEENLETRFTSVLANNDPEAIAWLLPQDTVLLGLADSGAHVSQLCDACFATDLLGNWVRDKEVMPLEHAIHKLTGEPAGGVRSARPRHARGRQGRRRRGVRLRHASRPARCAASATSPPTASGSSPTSRTACATCRERHRDPRRRAARRRRARSSARASSCARKRRRSLRRRRPCVRSAGSHRAHQADRVAVGILDDRVARAPERVVRRLLPAVARRR